MGVAGDSLLLDYPSPELLARLPLVRQAAGDLPGIPLGAVCRLVLDHLGATPLGQLQRDYVDTFDHTRRGCCYLTYFTTGDTRKRGVALVRLKQAYRRAGAEFDQDELPDHLGSCWSSGRRYDVDAGLADPQRPPGQPRGAADRVAGEATLRGLPVVARCAHPAGTRR
jgi:nitrate reductase delta subunit